MKRTRVALSRLIVTAGILFIGACVHEEAGAPAAPDEPLTAGQLIEKGTAEAKASRFAEARDHLEAAIEKNPDDPDAYYNLALVYEELGQIGRAIENYRRTLEKNPGDTGAHVNLTVLYTKTRQFRYAWRHARKAEQLGHPRAEELIEALTAVSREPTE